MTWKRMTSADKKRITSDWNQLFPSLGVFKPMHLMNRLGPLLVGVLLEVKSGNESYIPTFHVHNLARPFPVVSLGLKTTLNRQYVHLEWHERKYKDMALIMRETALIPLEADLKLETVANGYKTFIERRTDPFLPQTFEDLILVSAWCGSSVEVQKGLELAKSHMKSWPEPVLTGIGGLEAWLKQVEQKAKDKEKLLNVCEQQSVELKVDRLPTRAILC